MDTDKLRNKKADRTTMPFIRVVLTKQKMKKEAIIILSVIICTNLFGQKEQIVSDSILNQMFKHASGKYMRGDTVFQIYYPYYVVAEITNQNTQEIKEICVNYIFLEGAINIDSTAVVQAEKRKFKFYSDKALRNINFYDYNLTEYKECTDSVEVVDLLELWNSNPEEFMNLNKWDNCQKYVAHKLFKAGHMTGNGGIIGSLYIVTPEKIDEQKKRMN